MGRPREPPVHHFWRVRNVGLTVKVHKSQFRMVTCIYLGHVVGGCSLRLEQAKVEANWILPIPQTRTLTLTHAV